MVCGLLMASGVHVAKATVRPVVTATTGGLGNPVVSVTEDVVSGATTLITIILPAVAALLVLAVAGIFVWFMVRRRRRRRVAAT